jgi:hypothetical protein
VGTEPLRPPRAATQPTFLDDFVYESMVVPVGLRITVQQQVGPTHVVVADLFEAEAKEKVNHLSRQEFSVSSMVDRAVSIFWEKHSTFTDTFSVRLHESKKDKQHPSHRGIDPQQ